MNEYEIDHSVSVLSHFGSDKLRFAQYLSDWRDTVNNNSDGWPYWSAGSRAGDKLGALVKKAMDFHLGRSENTPSEAEFMKALTPIKSAATKHKLTAPELQDVDTTPRPSF